MHPEAPICIPTCAVRLWIMSYQHARMFASVMQKQCLPRMDTSLATCTPSNSVKLPQLYLTETVIRKRKSPEYSISHSMSFGDRRASHVRVPFLPWYPAKCSSSLLGTGSKLYQKRFGTFVRLVYSEGNKDRHKGQIRCSTGTRSSIGNENPPLAIIIQEVTPAKRNQGLNKKMKHHVMETTSVSRHKLM